jgi:DNA-binding NarL/FixJ family response regulator
MRNSVQALEHRQRGSRRLVIVSDDPLFVETTTIGFRRGAEFDVFHCPATGRAPAEAIARTGRDVVLIDDARVTDAAFDLVRELCAQTERPPVFVLSDLGDPERDQRMLDAGATAIVSRSILNGALVTLVRELAYGRVRVNLAGGPGAGAEDDDVRLTLAS